MTASPPVNDYLSQLLALHQDGRAAISAPNNWLNPPLLEVPTEIDAIVDRLERAVMGAADSNVGHWHFFIGSPGNGKSAAIGKLYRRLRDRDCTIQTDSGASVEEDDGVPYMLRIQMPGNKYPSAYIVQDASVVRNPYSDTVDAATDLRKTLKLAWAKGASLIVCTNRGVLEKAHRDMHLDRDVNSQTWFKILTKLTEQDPTLDGVSPRWKCEASRPVYGRMAVGYTVLDNDNLLSKGNVFDDLLVKATDKRQWVICSSCPAEALCPFKLNRDWLAEEQQRSQFIRLLKRSEVLSGQAVVFREILALIATLLSGCPDDYNEQHPCKWVQMRAKDNDVFSLASRRLYMSLFAGHEPHGLDSASRIRGRQLSSLRALLATLPVNGFAYGALARVVKQRNPSTDIGVVRFLGPDGAITRLDPCNEDLPHDFYQKWDSQNVAGIGEQYSPTYWSPLEQRCAELWDELAEAIERLIHGKVEARWALGRWRSAFLLRFGALVEGCTAWSLELDEFRELLSLVRRHEPSLDDRKLLRELVGQLGEFLAKTTSDEIAEVKLGKGVSLGGEWVKRQLRPVLASHGESGSVSLAVEFGADSSKREHATFAARMYLWLRRSHRGHLDKRCLAKDLSIGAADARIRAAARSHYSKVENDIWLRVQSDSETIRLDRFDGYVSVEEESP